MYIDLHTHKHYTGSADVLSIHSYYDNFGAIPGNETCTAGIHPWYLNNHEVDFALLQGLVKHDNVIAIGECGLDKVCKSEWQLQEAVFKQQIQLANVVSKPLIIHCVRAFDEVATILAMEKSNVPVIFHGYRNNTTIAGRLIKKDYYLSFGAALLQENEQTGEVFKHTPNDRFFLETDDATASIKDIYKKAAELKNIGEEAIILQVKQNFRTIFKQ